MFSGGSTLYNSSMYLDLGTLCYYPIDPTNATASTVSQSPFSRLQIRHVLLLLQLVVQANVRVPVTTTVAVNNQLSVTISALINNNQSFVNTSYPLTVKNYTSYTGFILFVSNSFLRHFRIDPFVQSFSPTIHRTQFQELVTQLFKVVFVNQ